MGLNMELKENALLDHLMKKLGLKTNKQLADYFDIQQPVISKIRNRRMKVSNNFILLIHEKTDMPVAEIRKLIARSENER